MLGHFYLPMLSDSAGSVLCGGKPTGTSPNPGRARPAVYHRLEAVHLPRVSLSHWTLPCKTDSLAGQADRAIWNRGLGKELVLDHVDLPESSEIPKMPMQPGEVGGKVKDQ